MGGVFYAKREGQMSAPVVAGSIKTHISRLDMLRRHLDLALLLGVVLIFFIVVKEGTLGVGIAAGRLHHAGVVLGVVAHALEVSVVVGLGEPAENVDALLPVDGERVGRLIVDGVLRRRRRVSRGSSGKARESSPR